MLIAKNLVKKWSGFIRRRLPVIYRHLLSIRLPVTLPEKLNRISFDIWDKAVVATGKRLKVLKRDESLFNWRSSGNSFCLPLSPLVGRLLHIGIMKWSHTVKDHWKESTHICGNGRSSDWCRELNEQSTTVVSRWGVWAANQKLPTLRCEGDPYLLCKRTCSWMKMKAKSQSKWSCSRGASWGGDSWTSTSLHGGGAAVGEQHQVCCAAEGWDQTESAVETGLSPRQSNRKGWCSPQCKAKAMKWLHCT